MTQAVTSSLIGVLGTSDARPVADGASATSTPEQAAQFASMLAALVAPLERAPEPTDEPSSELDVSESERTDGQEATTEASEGLTGTAAPASAESLVAASRAMAASVAASLEPVRSPGALEPEFREKLTRVVERMRELGHEVRIVETVRSQERQDKLFAQGRSEDGPVVTWTRRSRHTDGLAADVMIDGKYEGPGYRTLHRIANEEGLRTLGARDPGHLELPRAQASAERNAQPIDSTTSRVLESLQAMSTVGARVERSSVEPANVARTAAAVAQVATVARVARVADVAQVAPVAASDSTRSAAATLTRDLVRTVTRRRATEDGAEMGASRDEASARLDLLAQALGARGVGSSPAGTGEVGALARPFGGSQLDQVQRVLAAQDAARGRPITELSLALDAADSGVDRIRIGVVGRSVGATIEASDGASATRLGGRLDELTHALERAGLEPEAVRIASPEARDVARELGGRTTQVLEAGRGASTNAHDRQQDDTSRGREAWTQEDRRQQSGGRHRPRRDQQETKE